MAYATYRKQDKVLQADRDYSFCAFTANSEATIAATGRKITCGGSATSNIATIISNVGTFFVTGTDPTNQGLSPGFVPFNFAPYNYYQRPDERYTLGAFAEYEISPGAKPYLEAMFMSDHSDAQIAPSGNFFSTSQIHCDNPLLSAAQLATLCAPAVFDPADAGVFDGDFNSFFGNLVGQEPIFGLDPDGDGPLQAPLLGFTAPTQFANVVNAGTHVAAIGYVGRRNVEGGGRDDDLEHLAWRVVGGIRGDLLRGLSYDAYYQFGTTRLSETYLNDFSTRRLNQAIDVVFDPVSGTNVCRGTLTGTADPGCVPYNPFSTAPGAIGPDALAFLQTPGFQRGSVNQTIAQADFTLEGGEYGIQTPWSDRGVGLNAGIAYVKNSLDFKVDEAFRTGDLSGQGGPTLPVEGKYNVREAFAEIQVPIVSNSFFDELTLSAGYRYSDYKIANRHFNTDTYKLAVEFAPIRDVRLRASYNRAVRAPNIIELFSAQSVGLAGTVDPCAGDEPTATLAQCQLTGVSAAQFGLVPESPAGQYNAFLGGNPDLAPETADSYTVGVVLQPRWVPGFAFTVDYFDIKVKDVIGVIGFNTIMNSCINTGDPVFCDRIVRAQGNGNLWLPVTDLANGGFIIDINDNLGGLRTKGIDVNGSYTRRIGGMGTLSTSLVGTYLIDLDSNPFGDVEFDCASWYGLQCGTPNPKWRHKFRLGFTLPNGLGISGQWRYFSKVRDDTLSDDPDLNDGVGPRPLDEQLNAKSFFDLALTARLADRYNFRLGMNNILDTDPPIAGTNASGAYGARVNPPFGNGNTFPQVYDALGRYIFAGVTIDF
jgi:outer membrane receptor protein involved in Fe transport